MINEQLSAYLDGEASAEETDNLVAALKRDPALRDTYSRQQWLRHALRDSQPVTLSVDISARVMASLEDDSLTTEKPHPSVVSMPSQSGAQKQAPKSSRWHRPAAGLAIAASVVGAMVLVTDPLGDPQTPGQTVEQLTQPVNLQPSAVAQSAQTGQTRQVALQPQRAVVAPADHWAVSDPALEDQLNGYLIEHDGVARGYGLSGATPSLMRVATYGTAQ